MSSERKRKLDMLKRTLTPDQIAALTMVIQTAEVQGDYNYNGEDSVYQDDVASTLNQLAAEFLGN